MIWGSKGKGRVSGGGGGWCRDPPVDVSIMFVEGK